VALPGIVIRIGADTKNAIAGINRTQSRLNRFSRDAGKRAKTIGKNVGLAAAAGAAAAAAGVAAISSEGVKAAAQDQDAQRRLERTLKNVTGATEEQIAATEDYIAKWQRWSGVADDDIRPGLEMLVRSTKNIGRAQKISNTAFKISAQTGKPYLQVVKSLLKANNGQVTALKKLDVTVDGEVENYGELKKAQAAHVKAIEDADRVRETSGAKSKEYAKALGKVQEAAAKIAMIKGGGVDWLAQLNEQFDGAVKDDAASYGGTVARVATAIDDVKESLGGGILDGLGDLTSGFGDVDDAIYDLQEPMRNIGVWMGQGVRAAISSLDWFLRQISEKALIYQGLVNTLAMGSVNAQDTFGIYGDDEADIMRKQLLAQDAEIKRLLDELQNPRPKGSTSTGYFGTSDLYRYEFRKTDATERGDSRGAQKKARTRNPP
jgi:hypothetical protein